MDLSFSHSDIADSGQTKLMPRLSRVFSWRSVIPTRGRRQSKTVLQSTSADHISLETVASIVICRQSGDKCQSKTLFLTIFYLRSSVVLTFPIAAYPV